MDKRFSISPETETYCMRILGIHLFIHVQSLLMLRLQIRPVTHNEDLLRISSIWCL